MRFSKNESGDMEYTFTLKELFDIINEMEDEGERRIVWRDYLWWGDFKEQVNGMHQLVGCLHEIALEEAE